MNQEPILIQNEGEEEEYIANLHCDCGGTYSIKSQEIKIVEKEEWDEAIDVVIVACILCHKEREILFDVTDLMIDEEEEAPQVQPEILQAQEKKMQELEAEKDRKVKTYIPGAGRVTGEDVFANAPFCVPYKQLLRIYTSYEAKRLSPENTLTLIDEGKRYLERQIQMFEPNEFVSRINPYVADSIKIIQQGLHLMHRGYNRLAQVVRAEPMLAL